MRKHDDINFVADSALSVYRLLCIDYTRKLYNTPN